MAIKSIPLSQLDAAEEDLIPTSEKYFQLSWHHLFQGGAPKLSAPTTITTSHHSTHLLESHFFLLHTQLHTAFLLFQHLPYSTTTTTNSKATKPFPPSSLSVSTKSHSYTCTYSACYILTTMVGVRVCVWVILWVAAATHGDGVTVSAPAPSLDCSSAFVELTDCLTFVENGSTVAKPAGKCCSGLKKVVKREVSCLCDVFKQGASFGVNITKALTLPSACGVSTPPFTKCNNTDVAGVPATAPVPSPSPGAPSSLSTGAPSPLPGKSSAVSLLPGRCFRLLGSMAVTLWLHHQFQGLEL